MKILKFLNEKVKAILSKSPLSYCLSKQLFLYSLLYLIVFSAIADGKGSKTKEVIITISSVAPTGENATELSKVNNQEERVSQKLLIEYLIKQEIITDTKNYRLKLTNEFISINGKKQSTEIHEYVLKNFVKNPDEHLELTITISTD